MQIITKINIYLITKPILSRLILFIFMFISMNSINYVFMRQDRLIKPSEEPSLGLNITVIIQSIIIIIVILALYKSIRYLYNKLRNLFDSLKILKQSLNTDQRHIIILLSSLIILVILYLIVLVPIITLLYPQRCVGIYKQLSDDEYTLALNIYDKINVKYNVIFVEELIKENFIKGLINKITKAMTPADAVNFFDNEIKKQKYLECLFFIWLNLILLIGYFLRVFLKNKVIKCITFIRLCSLISILSFICFLHVGFMLFIGTFNIFTILCIVLLLLIIMAEYHEYNNNSFNFYNWIYWLLFIFSLVIYMYVSLTIVFNLAMIKDYLIQTDNLSIQIKYTIMTKYYYLDIEAYKIWRKGFLFAYDLEFTQRVLSNVQTIRGLLMDSLLLNPEDSLSDLDKKVNNKIQEKNETFNLIKLEKISQAFSEIKIKAITILENYYQQEFSIKYKMSDILKKNIIKKVISEYIKWDEYILTSDCQSEMNDVKQKFKFYLEHCPQNITNTVLQSCISLITNHIEFTWKPHWTLFVCQLIYYDSLSIKPFDPHSYYADPNSYAVTQQIEGEILTATQQQIRLDDISYHNFKQNLWLAFRYSCLFCISFDSDGLIIYVNFIQIRIH